MARWPKRRAPRKRGSRILFTTDIHGSDTCWRKFLNASNIYDTPILILGGDITGKMIVPIERRGGSYYARYADRVYADVGEEAKRELVSTIRRFGHYPVVGTYDELHGLDDEEQRDQVFRKAVYDAVADWVTLAEERLRGSGRRVFVAPGNDDFLEIDGALTGSDVVVFAENQCLDLTEHHQVITTGYSNPTPWETERELPEPELKARLEGMMRQARDPANVVAVIHPPPYDTPLDNAPELDEEFRMSVGTAGVAMAPVGSTGVRAFIEEAQPLLGLHGHVHDSQGIVHLGRTLCINPGSQYTEGVLAGAIVEIGPGEVLSHQFVSG
jgi:uncharacterized protein